jgi:hypothetical protein
MRRFDMAHRHVSPTTRFDLNKPHPEEFSPKGPFKYDADQVRRGRDRTGRYKRKRPAFLPAVLQLAGECLATTPGGVCHACTSRPRPYSCAQILGVVAVSLFLAPLQSRTAVTNKNSTPVSLFPKRRLPEREAYPAEAVATRAPSDAPLRIGLTLSTFGLLLLQLRPELLFRPIDEAPELAGIDERILPA